MPAVSIMIKPASMRCNMRCKYCFYHSLSSSRSVADMGLMTRDTAARVISSALELADGDSVYFAFQGGEPLIAGKDFFRYFIDKTKELNSKGSVIYYALQTNGTLVDEEWADIFKSAGFLIGLSLDGDRDGNIYRMDASYAPVFNEVTATADLLTAKGVDFNILTVVTARCAANIERTYRYFKSCGYKYLQFIPCLRPFGDDSDSDMYMTVEQYAQYLIRLFNLYVKDYVDGNYVSIRHFDNAVRLFLGGRPEQCGVGGHCSRQFVIEGNGNVYPCDFYCLDEWLLGNINDTGLKELARCDKAIKFLTRSLKLPDKCASCPYYRVCRGRGCMRSREDRDYCEAYKSFYSKCLPLFRAFIGERNN
ncbi:MAG: radical SAM protein [Clostridia bacterium]|nr:radical SAM protein [Clostridia bacterium]